MSSKDTLMSIRDAIKVVRDEKGIKVISCDSLISFKPRLLRRGTFKVGREVTAEVIPEYIKKQGKQTRHKNSDCSERNPAPWGGVIHCLSRGIHQRARR
jgi:hypothetical protein